MHKTTRCSLSRCPHTHSHTLTHLAHLVVIYCCCSVHKDKTFHYLYRRQTWRVVQRCLATIFRIFQLAYWCQICEKRRPKSNSSSLLTLMDYEIRCMPYLVQADFLGLEVLKLANMSANFVNDHSNIYANILKLNNSQNVTQLRLYMLNFMFLALSVLELCTKSDSKRFLVILYVINCKSLALKVLELCFKIQQFKKLLSYSKQMALRNEKVVGMAIY